MKNRSFRFATAMVAMAIAAFVFLSIGERGLYKVQAHQQEKIEAWSKKNPGFTTLIRQLALNYHNGRIDEQESNRAFLIAIRSAIPDSQLLALAEKFKKDQDYPALKDGLDQAAAAVRDIRPLHTEGYCFLMSGAVEQGCLIGGADWGTCSQYADSIYCDCMGGVSNGFGFCLM